MIKSATALKANVKNIANNNSKMAQAYIRLFFMERFLERVSKSRYKEQFILKGGMLECVYNHIIFAIGLLSCTLPDSSHGIP